MKKKANPTLIGLFFVGGLALGVAGLLAFSSRSLFHPQAKYILYFDGSLKGLNPGAPVKFRGVTVGSVVEVLIRRNQANMDHSMPVIVAIDKQQMQSKSDRQIQFDEARRKQLINQGYRARLDAESLITGLLYIELDVIPNAPPPVFHQLIPEFDEFPTAPSTVQQLLANLAQFDIPGLSEKLNTVLSQLDVRLTQLDVSQINSDLTNLLGSANQLIRSDLSNSLASLKTTLDSATGLIKRIDGRVDPLVDSAAKTLQDAQKALTDLRGALQNVSGLLGPDSAIPADLRQMLEELTNASRAIAELAEFLERNPNALLTGRKRSKEQP